MRFVGLEQEEAGLLGLGAELTQGILRSLVVWRRGEESVHRAELISGKQKLLVQVFLRPGILFVAGVRLRVFHVRFLAALCGGLSRSSIDRLSEPMVLFEVGWKSLFPFEPSADALDLLGLVATLFL